MPKRFASKFRKNVPSRPRNKAVLRNTGGCYTGNGTTSWWRARPGKARLPRGLASRALGKNSYVLTTSNRLQTTAGRQNAISYLYYDQVPLRNMNAAVVSGGPNSSSRLLHNYCYAEVTMTNVTNAVLDVQIYDTYFKRETNWTDVSGLFPSTAWAFGESQQGGDFSLIASKPSRVQYFNEKFKIAKKVNHLMAPGEVHKHKVLLRPNKFMSVSRVNANIRYAGLSASTMIVVKGTPADTAAQTDLSGGVVFPADLGQLEHFQQQFIDPTEVISTSPAALDIVYNVRYAYTWLSDIDNDITVSDSLATTGNFSIMPNTGVEAPYDAT